MEKKTLHGWGRHPVVDAYEVTGEDLEAITEDAVLSRGLGRSYGDAALPPAGGYTVAGTARADRVISFDRTEGILSAQAGVSLLALNRAYIETGWFVPVSPGTQNVTVGGMIASDVHGKNHHVAGCFGEHVVRLRMRSAGGDVIEVDDGSNRDLFRATLGGMGLTGHILEADVRMQRIPSPWIWEQRERAEDLDALIGKLRYASARWPQTVAWADCLARGGGRGRGTVIMGRWAHALEAPSAPPRPRPRVSVPFMAPAWALNAWTVGAQNNLRYVLSRPRAGLAHPQSFFYPLDVLEDWHRLYGKRGFTQYQCVLPHDDSHRSYHALMAVIERREPKPFLCVIKDCGAEGKGMLSFPKPGISFALDFPITGPAIQSLVDDLNELVCACGGRIYLAKDAFTRAEHFAAMEPRLERWNAVRRHWDPSGKLKSALSLRLLGDSE